MRIGAPSRLQTAVLLFLSGVVTVDQQYSAHELTHQAVYLSTKNERWDTKTKFRLIWDLILY